MPNKARQYKSTTIRRLDTLSGNQCASPDCNCKLIAKDGETIISKICHIEAANSAGPRFNSNMNDDERRHYDNLILLCDECHGIIDNPENKEKYSVELLKEWKRNHENIIKQNILTKKPTLLNQAINAISELELENEDVNNFESVSAFNIAEKIKFNSIKRNKCFFEEYSLFYGKINSLYDELEKQGSFKKEKLLRNIKLIYSRIKGVFIDGKENKLLLIQENADNIIEAVEAKLLEMVDMTESNCEDISFALSIIMVDAFMRCKILEEPK